MTFARIALALAAPLLLASCVLSPGKFVSSLHIGKDRSFTFAYQGEVILLDPERAMRAQAPTTDEVDENGDPVEAPETPPEPGPGGMAEVTAADRAERMAIVQALSKEVGYRSVEYVGEDKFRIDYEMKGTLDRNFIYPVNVDAKAVIPWIAIEVRKDGTVRVKALAFGDAEEGMGSIAKPDTKDETREGTFTLTTDATLVMQNNEEGVAPGAGTKVVWKVTPTSKTVPTAVVRF
jgi:hypothetical protein